MRLPINKILNGDALQHLKTFPDESINCVMTSPPYWALRDYGGTVEVIRDAWDNKTGKCWNQTEHDFSLSAPPRRQRSVNDVKDSGRKQATVKGSNIDLKETQFCSKCQAWKGQLGLEPTFDLYIKHLWEIFDEIKRVLRKDGTCWVNLGDTYGGGIGHSDFENVERYTEGGEWKREPFKSDVKKPMDKSLIMIPFRFSIEMVNRGWILRNTIIWQKPNCMPSSVKDRFTVDFEYIFFFVKNKKYWFETQYDPHLTQENRPDGIIRERTLDYKTQYPKVRGYKFNLRVRDVKRGYVKSAKYKASEKEVEQYHGQQINYNSQGRNRRTVWKIPTAPFLEAHFAVYPEALCEIPIKAGCPEFVCNKCGKAREKIFNYKSNWEFRKKRGAIGGSMIEGNKQQIGSGWSHDLSTNAEFKGWTNCNCNAGFSGGIVLDPFFGAGTTGVVALKQNKQFIGIELNPEYVEMAKKRLRPYLEQTKLKLENANANL